MRTEIKLLSIGLIIIGIYLGAFLFRDKLGQAATILLTPATSTIGEFRTNTNTSLTNLNNAIVTFTTTTINGISATAYTFATGTTATTSLLISTSTDTVTWYIGTKLHDIWGLATTTGRLIVGGGTTWSSVAVGTNHYPLTASSTATNGLAYQLVNAVAGGTGIDTSGSTGVLRVSSGAWSADANFGHLSQGGNAIPTGAWDFGGATGLEIPNGANPTVDAIGEVALDTTNNQLIGYDGTAARVFANPIKMAAFSFTSSSLFQTTNYPLWRQPIPITIVSIFCAVDTADTGDSVTLTLKETNSTGDSATTTEAIVCDTTGNASSSAIDAPNVGAPSWMQVAFSNSSSTVTGGSLTIRFYELRQ